MADDVLTIPSGTPYRGLQDSVDDGCGEGQLGVRSQGGQQLLRVSVAHAWPGGATTTVVVLVVVVVRPVTTVAATLHPVAPPVVPVAPVLVVAPPHAPALGT